MKSAKILFLISALFLLTFTVKNVKAQDFGSSSADPAIPERSGLYDDPSRPGIKVRVFVHFERPQRVVSSALTCGLADPESNAVVEAAGWKLSKSWNYNLNISNVPQSVGSNNFPTIAESGFNAWTDPTKVNFSRGSNTSKTRSSYDSQNIVTWGRTNGSALGVTYIRYNSQTKQVVDVDTILNQKFAWKWSGSPTCAYPDAYDAQGILTHELGHWVGLDDEYDSSYQHNTMYGYGAKGEAKKNTLTTGDKSAASAIYP